MEIGKVQVSATGSHARYTLPPASRRSDAALQQLMQQSGQVQQQQQETEMTEAAASDGMQQARAQEMEYGYTKEYMDKVVAAFQTFCDTRFDLILQSCRAAHAAAQ